MIDSHWASRQAGSAIQAIGITLGLWACDAGPSSGSGPGSDPSLDESAMPSTDAGTPPAGNDSTGPISEMEPPPQTEPEPAVEVPEGASTSEPPMEPVAEPADSSAPMPSGGAPSAEPIAEPVVEPAAEPTTPGEPAPAPDVEPSVEPVAEPVTEPAAEPAPLDPPEGEYGERAALPEANSEMAVATAGGRIYVLGGYPSSREVQSTVQEYDPETDAWSVVAPLPIPLHHPVAVGFEDRVYSLGGQTDDSDTGRTFVYDPSSDAWSELEPMPTPRGAGAGVEVDGRIYVVGGRPPAGNAFEVYEVASDGWEPLPDLPDAYPERNHLAAAVIDGLIYVAGGRYDGGSFQSPMTASLDVYDPGSGSWSRRADMLRPRGGVNGVAAHGCLHVFGGEGSDIGEANDVFPDHDVYDPATDTWTALPPLPVPVHGVTGAVFLDGLIYMPGGGTTSGGSSGSTIFQVFHPTTRCD